MDLQTLEAKQAALVINAKGILDVAEKDGRALTDDEGKRCTMAVLKDLEGVDAADCQG